MKSIFAVSFHSSKVLFVTGHQEIRLTPDSRNKDWNILFCNLPGKASDVLRSRKRDDLQIELGEIVFEQREKAGHFLL